MTTGDWTTSKAVANITLNGNLYGKAWVEFYMSGQKGNGIAWGGYTKWYVSNIAGTATITTISQTLNLDNDIIDSITLIDLGNGILQIKIQDASASVSDYIGFYIKVISLGGDHNGGGATISHIGSSII